MLITSIDHVILPVADLDAAAAPFERLGLTLTPRMKHGGAPTENRALFVGNGSTEFYIELLGVHDRDLAARTGRHDILAAIDSGRGLMRLMLTVADAPAAQVRIEAAGLDSAAREVFRDDGSLICEVVTPEDPGDADCSFALIAYAEDAVARRARHASAGLFRHELPLKRLDHLAIIAPQLEATTALWTEVLGVPVFGEVAGRGMLIRQMKIGDAIVELIGPDSPDSPIAARPAGLISMAAFEVADLDGAVALARERGFTLPDAAPGVLPRSRVSTISGDQLAGMALQLIAFA